MSKEAEIVNETKEEQPFEWTPETEIEFLSVIKDRPVGSGKKHLVMMQIIDDFYKLTGRAVHGDVFWAKLGTWYDLDRLEPDEILCHCNQCKNVQTDFVLDQSNVDSKCETSIIKDCNKLKVKKDESPPVTPAANESHDDSDEEDQPLKPTKPSRRSKGAATSVEAKQPTPKAKLDTPKRGTRSSASAKDTPVRKNDEGKKDRPSIGSRSLRPRGDDDASTKSSSPAPTPPPTKRSRRN